MFPSTPQEWVQTACVWEATARKMGNVHRYADFHDTTYLDFVLSAAAIAPCFAWPEARDVGRSILRAVEATRRVIGRNTNLGMILLFAPLSAVGPESPLRQGVADVLAQLTVADARMAFEAIRLAAPGGLGEATAEDVRESPTVTLLEAMRLAADRDFVARQYATAYSDVLDFGVPALMEGHERYGNVEAAIIHSQLRWLETYPDSLIARKNGPAVAEDVRHRAAEVMRMGGLGTCAGRQAGVELDRFMRSERNRLNPGTTADLIAACLLVALRENRLRPAMPFAWPVEDWL